MKKYSDMSKEELLTLKAQLDKEYADIKAKGLALDMSRGKPSADQLDLSMGLMNVLSSDSDLKCETGVDCRNYGVIDGIPEAKRLLGEMSEVDPDHIIIYGNSSLNVMFDSIARSMTQGSAFSIIKLFHYKPKPPCRGLRGGFGHRKENNMKKQKKSG